jgi:hypothetical protein
MFLGIRKKYWLYLASTVVLVGLMLFLNLSPVFAWRRTEVNGPYACRLEKVMQAGRWTQENLFRVDKHRVLEEALATEGIESIRIRLSLPDGIRAEVNRFEPVALVWGGGDRFFGLDRKCRLLPYDADWECIDLPVLTGLKCDRLFAPPSDFRVAEVISALETIRKDLPELHQQIAEIDFSDSVYVCLYMTSSQKRFLAKSINFASQLIKLHAISGITAWSEAGCCNLLYDDVVIEER